MIWISCSGLHSPITCFEKIHTLLAGVAGGRFAVHLSSLHIQSRIQRQRAVATLFKAMAFQSAGRQGTRGIQAGCDGFK